MLRRLILSLALIASVIAPQAAHAQTVPFRTITANISGLSSAATMANLTGQSSCTTTISGTFIGVLQFRASNDGVHWTLITSYPDPGTGVGSTQSTSSPGTWTSPLGSFTTYQVYFSSWTSGIANTVITCGSGPPPSTANVTATVTSGNVNVAPQGNSLAVAGVGSAGSPSGGVMSVQGVGGGTSVTVTCTNCSATIPWSYFVIPASSSCVSPAFCVIKGSPATFGGIINESTTSQPVGNCVWYDSASAASGNVLYIETTIGSGQIITQPPPGIASTSGLTVQCAATPGGNGLLVLYK